MNKKTSILSKSEILDAAEKTLRRFGPDKTSVTDVAKELGISHGTIYRHYPSKEKLREAVTERWLDEKIIFPLTEIAEMETNDPIHHLKNYLFKLIELKQTYAKYDPEMFKMYAEVTEHSAELIDEHVNHIIEQMNVLIHQGIERHLIQNIEIRTLARSIFYATSRFHHPAHAYEWENESIKKEIEDVWTLITYGFFKSYQEKDDCK
ncbi:TetR family transcriptional regulator [Terrilactibacillus laevilacticus]|uniref:TetR family transcriptional regulator n=1 Tax=Terrilactibacillus laevilacticus TaxID=1380157 RepID=A0ABW5PLJ1_9BACI|nr:TetR family transcriptional regulator [Terrilactibacillus laevilacticus]